MAIHARSTTAPTRPLLPFVHRPAVPVHDPRSAVEDLDEIRREVERQEIEAAPLPPPAPLPSLTTAFSRRRAIFAAVALAAAPVAALPAMAAEMLPNGAASVLSPNDARIVELADAYAALDTEVDAMPSTAPGYSDLIERYKLLEDEMVTTPADTIVGVGAKARVCQLSSLRDCMSDVPLSVADDVWRLHAAGGLV